MKKIAFIADFYRDEVPGGGESNDKNLINHLQQISDIKCFKSSNVSPNQLELFDFVIVGNFVMLPEETKQELIKNKNYIIYEHDHKYVKTRDPSKYPNFKIPDSDIINRHFYANAKAVVVLSNICKKVLLETIPECNVYNIGCSLWSEESLKKIESLSSTKKRGFCIMKSNNPTKNYLNTIEFCKSREIDATHINSDSYFSFLEMLSSHKTFIFLPTVLETFSRVCVEAKMMNVNTMTNGKMIGFFSEGYSKFSGIELINKIRQQQNNAYQLFEDLI